MSPRTEEPASDLRPVVPQKEEARKPGMWTPGAGLEAEWVLLCGNVHTAFRKALLNSSAFVPSPGLLLPLD